MYVHESAICNHFVIVSMPIYVHLQDQQMTDVFIFLLERRRRSVVILGFGVKP